MDPQAIITAIIVIISLFTGAPIQDQTQPANKAKVTDVVDGDTIDIILNEKEDTVRVIGIDTPEKYGEVNPGEFGLEDTPENRECLNEVADKASNYLETNIENKYINVEYDNLSDKRGSYGRLLAYIEYNKKDLGLQLLDKGYARLYESEFERKQKYQETENESIRNNEGIWNESCGVAN